MELTAEQESVVELSSGRHLVLAPPGSGKTEMLSRRILRALDAGVVPERMLCATFTNRAAFEMRDRVGAEAGRRLPDVGNLHHFCHRFLMSVGRLFPGKHVLDEVEQAEFVKEVVDVLREELRDGVSPAGRAHGVFVARRIAGTDAGSRRRYLSELLETFIAECRKDGRSPYPVLLSGVLIAHQARIGIPLRCRRKTDAGLWDFVREGMLGALDAAYCGLKRRFRCVDFDDLVNDTYLWLQEHPLSEERKFVWVQIDEVQDLNPLQWRIVEKLTARDAVSVYFGDVEQAIYSFLGASSGAFAEATAGCERHYFKTNFRAKPILLEVLMRYSLDALASDWEFLPAPVTAASGGEEADGRLFCARETSVVSVVAHVDELLASDSVRNVAILVRTNVEADEYEAVVRDSGFRYAKVSGVDLFSYGPMRDFLAFVSLFNKSTTRDGWARLFVRFADGIRSETEARYFVRDLFAAGIDPACLVSGNGWRLKELVRTPMRTAVYVRNLRRIESFRRRVSTVLGNAAVKSFRALFELFDEVALEGDSRYRLYELQPGAEFSESDVADGTAAFKATEFARERVERFLRYTDHVYREDGRPFGTILSEDWDRLGKLKEADLLVGDEKIVISTVHKAKGRQFDAVVIPDVEQLLRASGAEDREEARRLLYVAMSRAKRRLSLFGANTEKPEIACFAACLADGYRSCYLRRDDAPGSDDWLVRWERLAGMNASGACSVAEIDDAVRLGGVPVVRMALKCCRHLTDTAVRRRRLLEVVTVEAYGLLDGMEDLSGDDVWDWGEAVVGDALARCCSTAVECLRECGDFDDTVIGFVRCAALCTKSESVCLAVLGYLCAAVASKRAAVSVIGDFLYSRWPALRFAAAEILAEAGDGRWRDLVTGASSDFDRLASVADDRGEAAIRLILKNRLPEGYEARLRKILYARSR